MRLASRSLNSDSPSPSSSASLSAPCSVACRAQGVSVDWHSYDLSTPRRLVRHRHMHMHWLYPSSTHVAIMQVGTYTPQSQASFSSTTPSAVGC